MATPSWSHFSCTASQLTLSTVLACGQSFRWKQNAVGEWMGVIHGYVWRLKQAEDKIYYQVYGPHSAVNLTCSSQNQFAGTTSLINDEDIEVKQEMKEVAPEPHQTSVTDAHSVGMKYTRNNIKHTKKAKNLLTESQGMSNEKTEVISTDRPIHKFDPSQGVSALMNSHLPNTVQNKNFYKILHDYFQLDIDLDQLYKEWSTQDQHFSKVAYHFKGVRMLRQDPVENLLSFVCSSNNHISRISSMVEKMCAHYGDYITTIDGEKFYSFPPLSALCDDQVEAHLRKLGFGYRAKFISSIAKHITCEKGGDEWVRSLRSMDYSEAKKQLMTLHGVGAKVADCVCLMSLDKPGAIPVDTHVWQITVKHYMAKLNTAKSLTDKIYNEIGTFYRNLWGPYAGWAHSVLFAADLRHNKDKVSLTQEDKSKPAKLAGKSMVSAQMKRKKSLCKVNVKGLDDCNSPTFGKRLNLDSSKKEVTKRTRKRAIAKE